MIQLIPFTFREVTKLLTKNIAINIELVDPNFQLQNWVDSFYT